MCMLCVQCMRDACNLLVSWFRETALTCVGFQASIAQIPPIGHRVTLTIASTYYYRKGSRHIGNIDTHQHFIGKSVLKKIVELTQCVTDKTVGDILTKGLPAFMKHKVEMLGMGTKVCSACVCSVMIYKCHKCSAKRGKGDVARALKRDLSLDSHCSIYFMIRLIRSRWVWALSLGCWSKGKKTSEN